MAAQVNIKVNSDFAKASADLKKFGTVSEQEAAKIQKFSSSFKTEQIDSFIDRNRRLGAAVQATDGTYKSVEAQQKALQREMQRLIKRGLDPQDDAVQQLQEEYDRLDKEVDQNVKSQGKMEKSTKSLNVGLLAVGAAVVGAVVGVAKLSKELVLAASEAEETQNKFSVTFRAVSDEASTAAQQLADDFGLSRTAAQGLLADTGDLLSGFGFSGQAALDMSTQVNQLAVDLASFTNFSGGAEGASAALTKGLLGEREAMKSLGIAISEADIKQLAEEKGITGEIDRQTKAMLTLELAMRQSKNAIGDFSRSSDSFANQTRVAQARIEDLKVSLGNNLLPIANVGIKTFNMFAAQALETADSIGTFTKSAEGSEKIGKLVGNIAGTISALGATAKPILSGLKGALGDIIQPFRNLSDEADNSGKAFRILGPVSATIGGALSIIGTIVGGTITNLINFGKTIKSVADLGGAAWERLTGKISKEEFRGELSAVGDAWEDFGKGLVTTTADSFSSIGDFVVNFKDNSVESADQIQSAFQRTSQSVSENIQSALQNAGEGMLGLADTAAEAEEAVTDVQLAALEERLAKLNNAEAVARMAQEEQFMQFLNNRMEQEMMSGEARIEFLQAEQERILEMTELTNQEKISLAKTTEEEITKIQKEQSAQRMATLQAYGGAVADTFGGISALIMAFAGENEQAAKTAKALAHAEAGINSALAFTQVIADPSLPWFLKIVSAAGILGQGIIQQKKIADTPIPSAQTGGTFQIPDSGTSSRADQVGVMASPGETVSISPRGEGGRMQQINVMLGRDVLFSAINEGIESGDIRITADNIQGGAVVA